MKNPKRTALHKSVSSIFDGVPIPRGSTGQNEQGNSASPKPIWPFSVLASSRKALQSPIETVPKQSEATGSRTGMKRVFWRGALKRMFKSKSTAGLSREKMTVILIPILFIVLIFVLIRTFNMPWTSTAESANVKVVKNTNTIVKEIDWQIPEPYPTTLRDPMKVILPIGGGGGQIGSKLAVKGIVYSEDKPSAIINGKIVHQGEEVSGVKVVKINQDSVELEINGKSWTEKVQR